MKTFTLNTAQRIDSYPARVWTTILKYKKLFQVYAYASGDDSRDTASMCDEAMHRAYDFAMRSQNIEYATLDAYIIRLAKTVMKKRVKDELMEVDKEDNEPILLKQLGTRDELKDIVQETILIELQDLYLMNQPEFEKLRVFLQENALSIVHDQKIRISNDAFKHKFHNLTANYGITAVISALWRFFNELDSTTVNKPTGIKKIEMHEANFNYAFKIAFDSEIRSEAGKVGVIDKATLMSSFDPDLVKWSLIKPTARNVYSVDISNLIEYMYNNIFVDEGVNTPFIKWLGKRYIVKSCGGYEDLNRDLYSFMDYIHCEVVLNLVEFGVNKVIAISDDTVYFKAQKEISYNTIRMVLCNKKVIDLPVKLYKKGVK